MRVAEIRLTRSGTRWLTFDEPVRMEAVGSIVKRPVRRPRYSRKAIDAMTDARRKVPVEEYQSIVDEYANTTTTYRGIGDRYGVTGETIRLIIKGTDPSAFDAHKAHKLAIEDAHEWKRVWRAARKALAEDRRCKACGGWILRRSPSTCSHECAEAYTKLRIFDDPDYHRRAMAKVYLRSPEKYSDSRLDWARRILSDSPPPRNRTYLVPGSERAEIVKKYRPERYAELVSA